MENMPKCNEEHHQTVSREKKTSSGFHVMIYKKFINFLKQIYVMFWYNLSLDKKVRASPYDPPPENEVKMSQNAIVYVRLTRLVFLFSHIYGAISLYYCLRGRIMKQTAIFTAILVVLSQLGTVAGVHRLWSHNAFKANGPVRVFLMLCQTISSQFTILFWARTHRVHHKFSDTPRDPHNSKAGFFFCHLGWLLYQRSPEVKEEMNKIWLEDLKKDKVVMFQNDNYVWLVLLFGWFLPALIPTISWGENFFHAYGLAVCFRFVFWLNMTSTINSFAHFWGMKPFDRFIRPSDSQITWLATLGDEGWHNYHHAFPWDYRSSEFWGYKCGISTMFIEFCARMGWVHDLKTTSVNLALKRRQRTGDLSCNVWGWNDTSIDPIDKKLAKIYFENNSKNEVS